MSATTGLHDALLAVQAEAPTLPKNATNPHFKSKFTPLDTIVEVYGPILARHGLTWTTLPSFNADTGAPTLRYQLTHAASKEAIVGEMPLLLTKNDPQGQGAAITYARRYAKTAVLNIVADEDIDGNSAEQQQGPARKAKPKGTTSLTTSQLKKLTDLQAQKVEARLVGVDPRKIVLALNARGATDLPDLTVEQAKELVNELVAA